MTVLVTVENAPAGQFTQIVALPANYPVPTTMSMEALQSMSQDSIQYASGVGGGGDLGFQFMEAGNYTVVASLLRVLRTARILTMAVSHQLSWALVAMRM